jgi:transposase-like protein
MNEYADLLREVSNLKQENRELRAANELLEKKNMELRSSLERIIKIVEDK